MSHSTRARSRFFEYQALQSASAAAKSCAVSMRSTRHAASPNTLCAERTGMSASTQPSSRENRERAHREQARALVGIRCNRERAKRLLEPLHPFLLVKDLQGIERAPRDTLVVIEQGGGQRLDHQGMGQLCGDQGCVVPGFGLVGFQQLGDVGRLPYRRTPRTSCTAPIRSGRAGAARAVPSD